MKVAAYLSYAYDCHLFKSPGWSITSITENVNSPVFRKYLGKLAITWHMPSDTVSEQQDIFHRLFQMQTFTKKDSHPKQANWFAWNRCASITQLGEFWATRMVYESQLDGLTYVDDTVDSADLSTMDPGQGLKKLLAAGGGLRLANKIMQESMYQCWDWYTEQVKKVKTPAKAFKYTSGVYGFVELNEQGKLDDTTLSKTWQKTESGGYSKGCVFAFRASDEEQLETSDEDKAKERPDVKQDDRGEERPDARQEDKRKGVHKKKKNKGRKISRRHKCRHR